MIPWADLSAVIEPFYPKGECRGRPTVGVERMQRVHFLQHWFKSDSAVEEALYDSREMRRFVGIDLGWEPAPDETTICKFRHLLEHHHPGDRLFALMAGYLQKNRPKASPGTIADATIISAPNSTKNKARKRDPEMRQTRKSNQWYFGMKTHIGLDSRTKLIHSVAATAADVHDSRLLADLTHGGEARVWGGSAHAGQSDVTREHAPKAKDLTQKKGGRHRSLTGAERAKNRSKSRVRAKDEHPFLILKRLFDFIKVRYRGLDKNANWLFVACGLVNAYMARRHLLRATQGLGA